MWERAMWERAKWERAKWERAMWERAKCCTALKQVLSAVHGCRKLGADFQRRGGGEVDARQVCFAGRRERDSLGSYPYPLEHIPLSPRTHSLIPSNTFPYPLEHIPLSPRTHSLIPSKHVLAFP
jgi:hypothetical protein